MRRYADLLLAAGTAIGAAGIIVALDAGDALRVAAALPLVLVVPGYAVLSALLPGRGLEPSAKLAVSFGLSIAVAILGGLLLDVTSVGFGTQTWAIFLAGVTVTACLASALLRPQGHREARDAPRRRRFSVLAFTSFGAAVLIGAAAVAISRESAQERDREFRFTELSLLPSPEGDGYVAEVTNRERTRQRYTLRIFAGGQQVLGSTTNLGLDEGETRRIEVADPLVGGAERLEARLSLATAPTAIYRRVFSGGSIASGVGG